MKTLQSISIEYIFLLITNKLSVKLSSALLSIILRIKKKLNYVFF